MAGNPARVQSSDRPIGAFDEDINDPNFAHYRYERSNTAGAEVSGDEPVPLFLSNPADEHDWDSHRRSSFAASRILTSIAAASIVAMGLALFSVDVARDVVVSAKASLMGVSPVEVRVAVADTVQPIAQNVPVTQPDEPSRDEIAAAYQAAIKSQVVAREAPPVVPALAPPLAPPAAAPPPRHLDPDELGALLKRAKSLLAIGDIASGRLLLERAADAQEADAALMLARTYDPEVLGAPDARSITPDPAQARIWYRKAAELGSQHAQQRLAQMQN
ncbi:MAG: hypothetical protein ACJ8EL_00935 [Rhizomicrobium sp.]